MRWALSSSNSSGNIESSATTCTGTSSFASPAAAAKAPHVRHHNSDKIYSLEELQAIAALAEKYGVTVVSDEIHAPLTYAGETFVPYLNAGEAATKTGIIITSSSKAWNTAMVNMP